jgi:hypothetical protein
MDRFYWGVGGIDIQGRVFEVCHVMSSLLGEDFSIVCMGVEEAGLFAEIKKKCRTNSGIIAL